MKKLLFLALMISGIAIDAYEIPFKRKPLEIIFETKGGGISGIKWQNHLYTAPGVSFTERILSNTIRNGKKTVMLEFFNNLEFTPRKIRDDWNNYVLELSARGTGAFDWLRISKVYHIHRTRDFFTIVYTLENLDKKPRSAALWGRTFVRDYQDSNARNVFNQGHGRSFAHPGSVGSDEWCLTPKYPFSAVYGSESQKGVKIDLPYGISSAFFSWFSLKKIMSSLEFVTREIPIEPEGKYSFTVKVTMGKRVPGLIAAELKKAPPKGAKIGKESYAPPFYAAGKLNQLGQIQQPSGNTVSISASSMNLVIPRQFHDSVREVILPARADISRLGIYEVANKRADYSKELPFVLEKRSGRNVVRFPVPGFKHNFLLTRLDRKSRVYRDRKGNFIAPADYGIQICFDRKAAKKYPAASVGKAGLFCNSDFSKLRKDGAPEGWVHPVYYWKGGTLSMSKGAIQLRRIRPKPSWVQLYEFFVPEPGRKYTLSLKIRNDNMVKGTAAAAVNFFDADGKAMPKSRCRVYGSKAAHGWKNISISFYAPEKAAFGKFGIVLNGLKDHIVSVDDLQLVPEPYAPETVKLIDRLRDQLTSTWYKPLDLIERNSHAAVTPHEKWFVPAGFTMPDILFLPFNNGNYSTLERRSIVEVCQRMPLKYTMIPLLTRVSYIGGNGLMGVYGCVTMPELEPYTHEKLKTAPEAGVIWISNLDFKKHVKAPFIDFLRKRAKKSNLFFFNCTNIPTEFLGRKSALPDELKIVPLMRNVQWKFFGRIVQFYSRGNLRSCTVTMNPHNRGSNPAVPSHGIGNLYNNYFGREFPYWEFEELTIAKALRHLAGVKPDAVISAADQERITLRARKNFNAELQIRYENMFRQVLAEKTLRCQLKKGENRITMPPVGGRFGEHVIFLKLKGPKGYLDGGAVKAVPAKPLDIKIAFPAGVLLPYGKSVPVAVSCGEKLPGTVLEVIVEDSDYRQVARYSTSSGKLEFNFSPSFPRTVLYRVLAAVKAKDKVIARNAAEFSFSGHNSDPLELVSLIWSGADCRQFFLLKSMGFDQMIVWCLNVRNPAKVLRNLNMEPAVYSMGALSVGSKNWHKYRNGVDTSTKLSPRIPCFSDPALWDKAGNFISTQIKKGDFVKRDVKFHMIGDEQFLGRNVCISEHCLKDFRQEMKKYYKDIAKLNAAWGTEFASFDKVMPKTVSELTDKRKLGAFVPHKVFMTRVFAEKYMGRIRRELQKHVPGSVTGLSGTDNPGYHLNWPEVMKNVDYVAFYDGIQRKLAHDFGRPGALVGQWYGGYVLPTPHEGYVNSYFWRDLLSGNRLSPNYSPRSGVTGDLQPTPQLEFYGKLLKESRKGIAKLVFASKENPQVAIVYSQSSLFAATATIGLSEYKNTLSGWHALMSDLGIDYRFLYAPELPEKLSDRYKILVLAGTLSLSDQELAAVRRFAAAGGTVIADMDYGVYNEHGTMRPGKKVPVIRNIKLPQGEFRTTDPAVRFRRIEKVGKGRIVTLSILASGYLQTILGGIGGEVATDLTGSEKFCSALRRIVTAEFAAAGVARNRYLTGKDGKPRHADTVWREFNGAGLLGIWKFDRQVPKLDPGSGEDVTVTLPRKGYIYNVRSGKYVGYGRNFKYRLYPGGADVFALLPQKAKAPAVSAAGEVFRGKEIRFDLSMPGAGRVFRCELMDHDGKIRYSRNLAAPEGKASGFFQIAINDPAGNWKFKFTDTASGVSRTKILKVK